MSGLTCSLEAKKNRSWNGSPTSVVKPGRAVGGPGKGAGFGVGVDSAKTNAWWLVVWPAVMFTKKEKTDVTSKERNALKKVPPSRLSYS